MGSGLVEITDDDDVSPAASMNLPASSISATGDESGSEENFGFCEKWNTAAYTAEFSIVIGVISMFCVFIVILGNEHRKQHGWKVCGGLIAIHGTQYLPSRLA